MSVLEAIDHEFPGKDDRPLAHASEVAHRECGAPVAG